MIKNRTKTDTAVMARNIMMMREKEVKSRNLCGEIEKGEEV
jgi:hypothetical protein